MADSKNPGAGRRRHSYTEKLNNFSIDDLKALGLSGLLLLDAVNAGSLVIADSIPRSTASRLRDVVEKLYVLQDAVYGGKSDVLPLVVGRLLDIAETGCLSSKSLVTAKHSFFECSCGDMDLFCVNDGLPTAAALEASSMFLSLVVEMAGDIAGDVGTSKAFAALHLVEMAKAIVDSAALGLRKGGAS